MNNIIRHQEVGKSIMCPHLGRECMRFDCILPQALGVIVLVLGVITVVSARKEGVSLGGAFAGGAGLFIASGSITILVSIAGNIAVLFKLRVLLVIVSLYPSQPRPSS